MSRYKAIVTFSWEFDSDGTLEEASRHARETAGKMFHHQEQENPRIQIELQPIKCKNRPLVVAEYDPDDIFAKIPDEQKCLFEKDGEVYEVRMNSDRLVLFKNYRKCVVCGVEGKKMVLERNAGDKTYHFNFYALDDSGNNVLMTKDHIKAKSFGGADTLSNYQTMCQPCNAIKASYSMDLEGVRALKAVINENSLLPKEKLNKLIQKTRLKLLTNLNGQ